MDQWLANVYGTGNQEVDLEKVAQMAILEKLANDEGYDLSQLSEDEAVELANGIMAEAANGGEEQEYVEEGSEEDMAKEAQAKFEEADFLGRVMAHSYTQELEKIAADAGYEAPKNKPSKKQLRLGERMASGVEKDIKKRGLKPTMRTSLRGVEAPLRRAGGAIKSGLGKADAAIERGGNAVAGGVRRAVGAVGDATYGTRDDIARGARAVGGHVAKHKGKYMLGGALAAGGGIAAALHSKSGKSKSKTASAFEKLAEDRANELLENDLQYEPADDGDLDEALNARAVEMLEENGYTIE